MSEPKTFVQRFFDNFGKVPPEKPPIIPKPYRIPFFVGLSLAALIALALVVWFLALPGIQAHSASGDSVPPPVSTTK